MIVFSRAHNANLLRLSPSAIYVNASSQRLLAANHGSSPSTPITENKRWTSGHKLLEQARRLGQQLPLIFAERAELSFWAVAVDITVDEDTTTYRFANLRPLKDYRRSDLIVESTGNTLPDTFIRSYALIRTPEFLSIERPREADAGLIADELAWLEGKSLQCMITHRRREYKLRDAKIADELSRANGHLVCEVPGCGFDFLNVYGDLGNGYAQVHHLRPLADYDGEEETQLSDLVIICANCHAIVHRGGKCRELQELICGE